MYRDCFDIIQQFLNQCQKGFASSTQVYSARRLLIGRSHMKERANLKLIRGRTCRKNEGNPIQDVQHVTFDDRIPVQQRVQHN